jgi:hypothetical protein
MIRWLLNKAMTFVLYRPRLAAGCVKILKYFPIVNNKLISYADKEGLITPSHGPAPRKSEKGLAEVKGDNLPQASGSEEPLYADKCGFGMSRTVGSRGKNHDLKSPLEKWFY